MTPAPDLPRTGRLLDLPEARVRVYEEGRADGPPLVFLHGFMTSAFTWRHVHPAFADRYRVVLVDLPGSGDTPAPPGGRWDADRWVRLVAQLLDELGVDRAVLVGSQMGGSLAAWFAALRPERVEKLVVMAAGVLGEAETNLTLYRLLAHRRFGPLVARLLPKGHFRKRWLAAHGPDHRPEPGVVERYHRQLRRQGAQMARVGLDLRLSYGEHFDALVEPIRGLAVPTLLLFGADDRLVPPSTGRRFESLLLDSRLVVLADCGDFPQEEKPKEVVEAVERFLGTDDD
ncbi:alpha/beta hydrolase [Streptomyces sp. NPDC048057]|uniref:alpha/beta fold hydrolase n=1 Tax=Streptomyces sp. NPDC048057 TaxID=3155628 RepID=UPI0033C61DCE